MTIEQWRNLQIAGAQFVLLGSTRAPNEREMSNILGKLARAWKGAWKA